MNSISDSPNLDHKIHQNEIYNKIKNKDFSNTPEYSNGLTIENVNISENNKSLLQSLSKITKFSLISPLEMLYKEQYSIFKKLTNEREKCPICLCEFYDDIISEYIKNKELKDDFDSYYSHEIDTIILSKCDDHFYHIECLINYIQGKSGFKCAICQKIYGIIIGIMPEGVMTARLEEKIHCDGYPHEGTIIIEYNIKSGYLKNGTRFFGTKRTNYIPNTKNGRLLLGLLKIAFDRKLTFTIGTSVTTGVQNSVVWNGIHHKSNIRGGATHYGYPDPTYFNRVCEELAAKGVNKSDFYDDELEFLASSLMYGN